MRLLERGSLVRLVASAGAAAVALTIALAPACAQEKTYVMKIGTPTVNDTPEEWAKLFTAMIDKDTGGRIKIELYSASKLGPMAREIEGLQFGAIECAVAKARRAKAC